LFERANNAIPVMKQPVRPAQPKKPLSVLLGSTTKTLCPDAELSGFLWQP
jgi:hypothetical protein